MPTANKSRPAKGSEHGAVRKHDDVGVTDEHQDYPRRRQFNDDGNKIKDAEFVGGRSPDADPDDRDTEQDKNR